MIDKLQTIIINAVEEEAYKVKVREINGLDKRIKDLQENRANMVKELDTILNFIYELKQPTNK